MKRSVRFMALMTLERVNKGGAYSNLLLNEMINQGDLNQKDIGLFTELVYGTISRHRLIAFYVAPLIANAKKWMTGSKLCCICLSINSNF